MAASLKSHASITVSRGFKESSSYVWSPFATKLEARLRFSGVPYSVDSGGPRQAPRGKIPYVTVTAGEQDPFTLSDSTLIVSELVKDGTLDDLNANLSATQRAQDLAIRALLEDKLNFYHTYERWHENYYTMRSHVLAPLPYPMQVIIGMLAYRGNVRTIYGQGTGRLSGEEIAASRAEIWESLNGMLVESRQKRLSNASDKPFWILGGERPTEADAVLFGYISSVLVCKAAPSSRKLVRNLAAVVDYAQRIHDVYFPDYDL
ncbi:hypothetical protein B9Z65_2593 [Elsinoe australis]|uniref:Thioredoxin-like fold domain-containing protein n=1 Tax=Elsinoe australis TaxID=40998 RepID=A0A2P8A409_9PEZI|nr:hypothetical protein B9Z65_2593 [Elsinoe australis]